jgi:hypothetical protein
MPERTNKAITDKAPPARRQITKNVELSSVKNTVSQFEFKMAV